MYIYIDSRGLYTDKVNITENHIGVQAYAANVHIQNLGPPNLWLIVMTLNSSHNSKVLYKIHFKININTLQKIYI